MNFLKRPVLWFIVLVLAACSARVMGVRHADKIAMHQVDRMFDLTGVQDDAVAPAVKKAIDDFKKSRLPVTLDGIDRFREAWDKGVTEGDALALYREYEGVVLTAGSVLAEPAGAFLATLTDDQIAHLQEELDDANETLADLRDLPDDKFAKKSGKNLVKGFEHWLGSLSDEQEAEILREFPANRAEFEERWTLRLASQRAFVDLLKSRPGPQALTARQREWFAAPEMMSGATRQQVEARRDRLLRFVTVGYRIATAKQRRHASEEMRSLTADVREALR